MGLRDFQIPEELQQKYGYLPLTDDDKRKIFGGNLAGLLGIDPTVRRIGKKASEEKATAPVTKIEKEMKTMDSTYEVLVSTPMGELPGKVRLNIDGTNLSGVLSLLNNDNPFSGGTIEDGKVAFSGKLKTPMGKMSYNVTGTFIDGRIEAVANTKMGNLEIKSK